MQKCDERTDRRTDVRKEFYNLPTTAFGHGQEIKKTDLQLQRLSYHLKDLLAILNKIDVQSMQMCKVQLTVSVIVKEQITVAKD